MNRARRFWLNLHLWIGLVAGLLLVIVGLSGSALVWHDGLDALLNPERNVLAVAEPASPASAYASHAAAAFGNDVRVTAVRLPITLASAVQVDGVAPGEGRPRSFTAWLNPRDGRLLDLADRRTTTVGILHILHGTLLVPQWYGRQIVGWLGVLMTVSVLSGVWLWWPRVGSVAKALWWRRGRRPTANLHHMLGAWIALPLLIVSLTGVYISFPQTARALFGPPLSVGGGQARPPFASMPLEHPILTMDGAVAAALAAEPGARLLSVAVPTEARPAWRLQVETRSDGMMSLEIDDRTGMVAPKAPAVTGGADPVARLMRRLHDGQDMGGFWQVLVFLTGLLPALLWITGIIMWLRRRARPAGRASQRSGPQPVSAPSSVGSSAP